LAFKVAPEHKLTCSKWRCGRCNLWNNIFIFI